MDKVKFCVATHFLDEIEVLPHIFKDKIEDFKCSHTYLQMKLKVWPHNNWPCHSYFWPKMDLHGKFIHFQ